jgi:hypothetical protein
MRCSLGKTLTPFSARHPTGPERNAKRLLSLVSNLQVVRQNIISSHAKLFRAALWMEP